jgi:hypothetical protein
MYFEFSTSLIGAIENQSLAKRTANLRYGIKLTEAVKPSTILLGNLNSHHFHNALSKKKSPSQQSEPFQIF